MKREISSDELWNPLAWSSSTRTAAAPVSGCENAHKENDLHAPRPIRRKSTKNYVELIVWFSTAMRRSVFSE
jgi:hypothetical protein